MDKAHRLPPWERSAFIEERGFRCAYCGMTGDRWTAGGKYWHIDHIVPVRRGGAPRDWSNLALACALCNILKSDRVPVELPDWLPQVLTFPGYGQYTAHVQRMLAYAGHT